MNLLEFKRRLMTDPYDRDPDFVAARKRGGEFAAAAAESDDFEHRLQQALRVPVPEKLAEDIIFAQSMQSASSDRGRLPGYLAIAAALVLAVAVGTFVYIDREPPGAGMGLEQHLAWHWQMDGPSTMVAAEQSPSDPEHVRRVFSELGVHLDQGLMEKVRLSKFCPTPDGVGAHVILTTDEGPVTLYYMPRTRIPDAPRRVELPNGMEGWVVNLERGSMALVAEAGVNTPELASEIKRQLSFPPGINL